MQLKVTIDRERAVAWFGTDGTRRLPEETLPPVLTHGPTRRFLTEIGLPREGGAHLEFDTDPEVLLQPLASLLDGPSTGADHLLSLGDGTRDWLVLDGRTGQVALAGPSSDNPAQIRFDVLASDVSVLLFFLHELEAFRKAAADPTACGGRRGPAAVEEVTRALEERLRAADPAVFGLSGYAPHWSGVLMAYGLRWAALSSGPADENPGRSLAFEITAELAAELGEALPVQREDLPDCLHHEPTRRLLTAFGLPTLSHLRGDQKRPLATLRERFPRQEKVSRVHQFDQVFLGWTAYDCEVVVDGTTGRLEVAEDDDEDWPAAHLHTDLSAYYLFIWTVDRLREEARRWTGLRKPADWQVFDHHDLLTDIGPRLLAEIDPSAFEDEASLWNALAGDHHMGGLLG